MLVKDEIIPLIIFLECQSPKPRTTDRDSCKNKRDADAVKDARIESKERKTKNLYEYGKNKPRTDVNDAFNKALHAWPRCR